MKNLAVMIIVILVILFYFCALEGGDSQKDSDAVGKAALDYIESWFDSDAEGLKWVLHKELAKRYVFQDEKTGEEFFRNLTNEDLINGANSYNGNIVPKEKRGINISVLAVYRDMASVRIDTATFVEYLHLARTEDEWKIINSLFYPRANEQPAAPVDPVIYQDFAGIYEFTQGFKVTVSVENNRLFFLVDGQPHFEAIPESENKYYFKSAAARLEFIRDASGKVIEMITYQPAGSLKGKKIE